MVRIKELRTLQKVSQRTLANALNVSNTTVSMWETDSSEPSLNMIVKIADYFDVTSDYLIGRTSCPSALQSEKEQPTLPTDQQELLQMYVLLSDQNQGRLLERARILAEDEIVTKKSANKNVG